MIEDCDKYINNLTRVN